MFGRYSHILFSPDGQYAAVKYSEVDHESGIPTLEILTSDGELLWSIPDEGGVPLTDPYPHLEAYRWSEDSSVLYFYYAFGFDGAFSLWDGYGLKQIDVNTGEISTLISSEGLSAFAISPNDRYLAYVRSADHPPAVVIRDLISGEQNRYPIEVEADVYEQAGWITWSPFSDALIFHTLQDGWMAQAIFFNHTSGRQYVFLEYYIEAYQFDEWLSPGTVRYVNLFKNATFDINVWTGAGAPTPKP